MIPERQSIVKPPNVVLPADSCGKYLAHRRGSEVEITFDSQLQRATDSFKLAQREVTPFLFEAADVAEEDEVISFW